MKRRDLVFTALTGAVATLRLPRFAEAAETEAWTNVLFSEDHLGHWKGMEAHHVPVVQVNGDRITIRTPHPMTEPHYIVSHTVGARRWYVHRSEDLQLEGPTGI